MWRKSNDNDLRKQLKKILKPFSLAACETEGELNVLEGERLKIIIPSSIFDNWSRSELLLGVNINEHTDTLTKASNLNEDFYRKGEIHNKQQYQNDLE